MNLFFYKLILMAIALMPNTDGVHQFTIKPDKSSKPNIATIDRKSGEFESQGIYYTVNTGKETFKIHQIDNGLYKLYLANQKPVEIDMAPYFTQLDYNFKVGSVQSIGQPPIQIIKSKQGYRIFSAQAKVIIQVAKKL
ncbi:MAG: hypothetical protein H3C43_08075 [Leptonema sp. (in: Bacteria)]|nr:hypothetical protein [Leptonema sp. (in: bacteria)]